jgi:hypothetical protein
VEKDAFALNPRGEFYSRENVRELLDMRNFMETLRSSGVQTGGPEALSSADRQRFANRLDRFLAGAGVKPANGTSVSTRKFASIDRNRGIGERRGSDDE